MESELRIVSYEREHVGACEALLDLLPDWFGIPDANERYLRELEVNPAWVALEGDRVVGCAMIRSVLPESIELQLIAVDPRLHRRGIGRRLVDHCAHQARRRGARVLFALTLGPSSGDPYYASTQTFYEKLGFIPLLETSLLWGEESPALILVLPLNHERSP